MTELCWLRKRKKGNKGEDTKSSRPCTPYWHNCEREDKISFGFSPISVDSVTLNEHQQFLNETLALALWDSAQKVTPHLYLCIIPQTLRGTRRTLSILNNSAFQLLCFLCYLMFMLCPSVQCVCLGLQVSLKPISWQQRVDRSRVLTLKHKWLKGNVSVLNLQKN